MKVYPPNKRRPGYPTKRSARLDTLICGLVSRGMPFRLVCQAAGISGLTFNNWRTRDPQFSAMIEAAIARGVQRRLKVVERCMASEDENLALRAATWWLTHVVPEFAGNRLELSGPDGAPLAGVVAVMLPPKVDTGLPALTVPALEERSLNGNGG
jgi:hypothetical protein